MSTDTVCRVCLVNNLNLYSVRNDLQNVYERIAREKYNKPGYPVFMCYICLSVLRKCHRFMETARDTNYVLKQWYLYNQQTELIMAKPLTTYSVTKTEVMAIGNEDFLSEDNNNEVKLCLEQLVADIQKECNMELDIENAVIDQHTKEDNLLNIGIDTENISLDERIKETILDIELDAENITIDENIIKENIVNIQLDTQNMTIDEHIKENLLNIEVDTDNMTIDENIIKENIVNIQLDTQNMTIDEHIKENLLNIELGTENMTLDEHPKDDNLLNVELETETTDIDEHPKENNLLNIELDAESTDIDEQTKENNLLLDMYLKESAFEDTTDGNEDKEPDIVFNNNMDVEWSRLEMPSPQTNDNSQKDEDVDVPEETPMIEKNDGITTKEISKDLNIIDDIIKESDILEALNEACHAKKSISQKYQDLIIPEVLPIIEPSIGLTAKKMSKGINMLQESDILEVLDEICHTEKSIAQKYQDIMIPEVTPIVETNNRIVTKEMSKDLNIIEEIIQESDILEALEDICHTKKSISQKYQDLDMPVLRPLSETSIKIIANEIPKDLNIIEDIIQQSDSYQAFDDICVTKKSISPKYHDLDMPVLTPLSETSNGIPNKIPKAIIEDIIQQSDSYQAFDDICVTKKSISQKRHDMDMPRLSPIIESNDGISASEILNDLNIIPDSDIFLAPTEASIPKKSNSQKKKKIVTPEATPTVERNFAMIANEKLKESSIVHESENLSEEDDDDFDPDDVDLTFKRNPDLTKTKKTKTDKLNTCDICNKPYLTPSSLRRHIGKKHPNLNIIYTKKEKVPTPPVQKTFTCTICMFTCKRNSLLNLHYKTHTGEKPFSCDLCSFRSTTKRDLTRHSRSHTGEKPYSCQLCNFKFVRKEHLRRHMASTHSSDRPFSCNMCDFQCAIQGYLSKHIKKYHS